MRVKTLVSAACSTVGALLGALLGEVNGLLVALIILMILDYITGILSAIYLKELSSERGYKGLIKKVCILIVVIIGNTVDSYVLKQGTVCRSAVILFYLSNEGISILENYNKMGLPFPDKLKDILKQLNETKEKAP